MKKKTIISIMSFMLLFGVNTVNASEVCLEDDLNSDNIKIVEDVKNSTRVSKFLSQASPDLKRLYEEQPFMIGEEWFDNNGELIPALNYTVNYVEISTYIDGENFNNNIIKQKQLSAEEYANWKPKQRRDSCNVSGAADCWETAAKRLFVIYQKSPDEKLMLINQWKSMPTVRSYDTIGLLFNNFTMTRAIGRQWFNTAAQQTPHQYIDYSYKGSNMKISDTTQSGVSISQNLVNDAYSYIQNDLYVYGNNSDYALQVAGSYQHAVKDIDLATSKNFTFNGWGMGKVFDWKTSWSNWDNMQGVCFNWTNYLWTC